MGPVVVRYIFVPITDPGQELHVRLNGHLFKRIQFLQHEGNQNYHLFIRMQLRQSKNVEFRLVAVTQSFLCDKVKPNCIFEELDG